jgi:hypothetical protein
VEQDCSEGSASRSFLVFVGPAAVVRERFAAKEIRIRGGRRWIVHQHHENLAAIISVGALVIVPALLRGVDAITNKNQVSIDVNRLRLRSGKGNEIVGKLESLSSTRARDRQRCSRIRFHTDQRNRLKETSVLTCAFCAHTFELRGDIFSCDLTTTSACAAAFKQIVSEKLDVGLERCFSNRGRGRCALLRNSAAQQADGDYNGQNQSKH